MHGRNSQSVREWCVGTSLSAETLRERLPVYLNSERERETCSKVCEFKTLTRWSSQVNGFLVVSDLLLHVSQRANVAHCGRTVTAEITLSNDTLVLRCFFGFEDGYNHRRFAAISG